MAESLADTAVGFEAPDSLARVINGPALNAVLRWTASRCAVRSLASDIQDAARRISGLVLAITGFTPMDYTAVSGRVDLVQGPRHTIAVLRANARASRPPSPWKPSLICYPLAAMRAS
jgi:hypothetical protein